MLGPGSLATLAVSRLHRPGVIKLVLAQTDRTPARCRQETQAFGGGAGRAVVTRFNAMGVGGGTLRDGGPKALLVVVPACLGTGPIPSEAKYRHETDMRQSSSTGTIETFPQSFMLAWEE